MAVTFWDRVQTGAETSPIDAVRRAASIPHGLGAQKGGKVKIAIFEAVPS